MRLSREELLQMSGARPEELDTLEAQRMIVPSGRCFLFWRSTPWYSQAHLDVLRRYAVGRRALEVRRRLYPSWER